MEKNDGSNWKAAENILRDCQKQFRWLLDNKQNPLVLESEGIFWNLYKRIETLLGADQAPRPAVETGWVIEKNDSGPSRPLYWTGHFWSYDHLQAIRYAREIDAIKTESAFDDDDPLPNEKPHRICEHQWG